MTMDKTSLGPQMAVWAEALCTGKANPYPECLLQQKQNSVPSMLEVIQHNQLATR